MLYETITFFFPNFPEETLKQLEQDLLNVNKNIMHYTEEESWLLRKRFGVFDNFHIQDIMTIQKDEYYRKHYSNPNETAWRKLEAILEKIKCQLKYQKYSSEFLQDANIFTISLDETMIFRLKKAGIRNQEQLRKADYQTLSNIRTFGPQKLEILTQKMYENATPFYDKTLRFYFKITEILLYIKNRQYQNVLIEHIFLTPQIVSRLYQLGIYSLADLLKTNFLTLKQKGVFETIYLENYDLNGAISKHLFKLFEDTGFYQERSLLKKMLDQKQYNQVIIEKMMVKPYENKNRTKANFLASLEHHKIVTFADYLQSVHFNRQVGMDKEQKIEKKVLEISNVQLLEEEQETFVSQLFLEERKKLLTRRQELLEQKQASIQFYDSQLADIEQQLQLLR